MPTLTADGVGGTSATATDPCGAPRPYGCVRADAGPPPGAGGRARRVMGYKGGLL
jgi:hypothetical protein